MPSTYEKIATTTLGSASVGVTFSSIPSTYTDLKVIINGTASGTSTKYITFNNETLGGAQTTYSDTYLYGNGSSALSNRDTSSVAISFLSKNVGISSTSPFTSIVDVMSYTNTAINKTCLIANANAAGGSVERIVALWRNTNAVNAISFLNTNGSGHEWNSGSTFTLYGIKAA
jgi:hypothetical protein